MTNRKPNIPVLLLCTLTSFCCYAENTTTQVIHTVQQKVVKIHGAGGVKGLEAYHTGILISDQGHILTAWSYVLDTESLTATLADGRKHRAKLLGLDPQLEIAIVKIEADKTPCFNLDESKPLEPGRKIFAFSNLYGVAAGDELISVQHGIIVGNMDLSARRGAFPTPYKGSVYVLDAITNNPGAAGGALTDTQGNLVAVLGKELRSAHDNTWLNYALPMASLKNSIANMLAGKSNITPREAETPRPAAHFTPAFIGITLVPNVLVKTPPYIDKIAPDSAAAKAMLQPDDLILFVNGKVTPSCKAVLDEMSFTDQFDELRLTIQRGQELMEVTLRAN
jgi:S1-C subfamily serine protease